jgi:actin related protein 2/3 complex, subunit 4
MASHSLSLDQYGEELSDALYRGLCIRDFPCQEAERHNKPEVEFGTCRELLLPLVTVSRQSGDACCVESSINSCRVSFKFREGDILDRALAHGFFRYLGLKAEDLPILRRKPSAGYQVSFLVTAALLKHQKVSDVVRFLVSFALDTPAFLRELKCSVNKHTRCLAAAALSTRCQASLAEDLPPESFRPETPGAFIQRRMNMLCALVLHAGVAGCSKERAIAGRHELHNMCTAFECCSGNMLCPCGLERSSGGRSLHRHNGLANSRTADAGVRATGK